MENFDSSIFRNAVQAMTEAQAMAPGEELPDRGQDGECAEWVGTYAGDADDFLAGYVAAIDDDVEVDEGLVRVARRLKKWRKLRGDEWSAERTRRREEVEAEKQRTSEERAATERAAAEAEAEERRAEAGPSRKGKEREVARGVSGREALDRALEMMERGADQVKAGAELLRMLLLGESSSK